MTLNLQHVMMVIAVLSSGDRLMRCAKRIELGRQLHYCNHCCDFEQLNFDSFQKIDEEQSECEI